MGHLEDIEDAAKAAADKVGPRVYRLTGLPPGKKLSFFVLGCQGNGSDGQKEVAQLMKQILAERPEIAFVVGTGDNLYDYGASSPLRQKEKGYDKCFYNIYDHGLSHLVGMGNHDGNYSLLTKTLTSVAKYTPTLIYSPPLQGRTVEINEIAHSYTPEGIFFPDVGSKRKFYLQEEIPLSIQTDPNWKPPKWIQPWFFNSYIAGDNQIFNLNANSLLIDWLNWKNEEPGKWNQAQWCHYHYEEARKNVSQIFTNLHNPFVIRDDRALPSHYDTGNYLEVKKRLPEIQEYLKTETESYNELLWLVWNDINWHQIKGTAPDIVNCAHNHALTYYNDIQKLNGRNICQVGSGGGGGDLQGMEVFYEDEYFSTYLKKRGVVVITTDLDKPTDPHKPKSTDIEYFTTDGLHLLFNSRSHEPTRTVSKDMILEKLRDVFLATCKTYFQEKHFHTEEKDFIREYTSRLFKKAEKAKRRFTGKQPDTDVERVQEIIAYLNQPTLGKCETVILYLKNILLKMSDKTSALSFANILTLKLTDSKSDYLDIYDLFQEQETNTVLMFNLNRNG